MRKEELRLCRKQQPLANSLHFPLLSLSPLSAAFAELPLPPQLGTHQPSSPPWVLLAGAWQSGQRRAPQQRHARDGSASATRPGLTSFIPCFLVFVFFFFSWGAVSHFNLKKKKTKHNKNPTMTKPDINRMLVGRV